MAKSKGVVVTESVMVAVDVDTIREVDWLLEKDMTRSEFVEEALSFYISHIKSEEAKRDWM